MIYHFEAVNREEYGKLKGALALITVLVAGADKNIDQEETEWAEKLTKIRSYANDDTLHEFYKDLGVTFHDDLIELINKLPGDVDRRREAIEEKLGELNPIIAKLPAKIGALLYDSYVTFAKHVAKSSGGFLGFGSISANESKVMELDTINPIIYTEEEEE